MSDQYLRLLRSVVKTLDALKASLDKHREAISKQNETTQRQAHPDPQQVIQPVVSLPPAVTAYYEAQEHNRPSTERWERIKRGIEFLAFGAAITLAILTYRTLQQVKRQADAAQSQVGIMQRQLEAADRPWMKIIGAKPTSDLKFSMMQRDSLVSAMIVVGVKNIGKSVALNVTIHARMTLTEDSDRLSREESDVCSGVIETLPVPVLTVFPDDDTKDSLFVYGVERLPAKIEKPIISVMDAPFLSPPDSKLVSPKFVGCASYTYPSSSVTRHSGFRFALEYGETPPRGKPLDMITAMLFRNNQPHFVRYFVVAKDIPEKELRVERFFAGFDAN
jgi:hypothetical protein